MSIRHRIRQWRYPKELRIGEPDADIGFASLWGELAAALYKDPGPTPPPPSTGVDTKFLAESATGLWRLRQKMTDPGTGQPTADTRKIFRHFESVWDRLHEEGITVIQHTGEEFDPGLSLKVIAFEPAPGFRSERVIETIKPTVFLGERMIQMGEVIVGTPEATTE